MVNGMLMRKLGDMKYPLEYCIQGGNEDDDGGAFLIPFEGRVLYVIASIGMGWDHVSVSLSSRCPNWREMSFIKGLFFNDDEVVMQLHVAKKDHINLHPYCLHLWKPQFTDIPLPPNFMVG